MAFPVVNPKLRLSGRTPPARCASAIPVSCWSSVIRAFQDGATPETIVQRYSTLSLPDVYAVIAYYLRHRAEADAYMTRCEKEADELREQIESRQGDLSEIRARLLAHRQA